VPSTRPWVKNPNTEKKKAIKTWMEFKHILLKVNNASLRIESNYMTFGKGRTMEAIKRCLKA
jgi:hypothetical protein